MDSQQNLTQREERIRTFAHYQYLVKQNTPREVQRVVDVGCGSQEFWSLWFQDGISTWGVEFTDRDSEVPIRSAGETTVVRTRIRRMWPFSNNFFDAATVVDVDEMYEDPLAIVSQTHRLLKKDGVMLIVVSSKQARSLAKDDRASEHTKPDYWYGVISGLGFRRVQMKFYFTYIFPPFTIFQRLFRTFGLPVREYMLLSPSPKIAKRYIFLSQK